MLIINQVIVPLIVALSVTFLLVPMWISVCNKWKLFDFPDMRKLHSPCIPTMGGLAIYAGIFMSFFLFADLLNLESLRYLLCSSLLLFFTGFFDDLTDLPASRKLFFQVIAALLLVSGGNTITSLYGLFGINEIPVWLQYPMTILFIVAMTNAYNLIDGIDGLAGSIGVISSLVCGFVFLENGQEVYATLSFCITGSLAGFLFFNFHPAKIFMGDTGSLLIGFLLAFLAIKLLSINATAASGAIIISPAFILSVLFVPLYDTIRVLVIRMLNGDSPFTADRNHLHHMILKQGFTHGGATIILCLFTVGMIILQHFLRFININELIILMICLAILTLNTFTIQKAILVTRKLRGKERKKLEIS